MAETKAKKGDRVRVLVNAPEGKPVEATVLSVTKDGRLAVEFDHYVANAHGLDGKSVDPEKFDGSTGIRYGKGWNTRHEYVEVL